MKRSTLLGLAIVVCSLLTTLVVAQAVVAQTVNPQCDVDAVIKHQEEHAQELANFAVEAKTDLNAALATLYRTSIAYQALAVECGFTDHIAVETEHQLEHSDLIDTDTHSDTHGHGEEEADVLALARTIGDPEQGKILFNTVRPEVAFACATCHRVDSTETLVGPGLLGISGHAHNSSESDTMAGMNIGGGTATPDTMSGMNMSEATAEATAAPELMTEEKVEFLRTSITNPSAFVMTGFPDNLMPKVYGTIFTPEEINDLIAYLFTLD